MDDYNKMPGHYIIRDTNDNLITNTKLIEFISISV